MQKRDGMEWFTVGDSCMYLKLLIACLLISGFSLASVITEFDLITETLEDDGIHGLKITILNKTCIEAELYAKDVLRFEYGMNIPFSIDGVRDGFVKIPGVLSGSVKREFCFSKLFGKTFKFGFNSTIIRVVGSSSPLTESYNEEIVKDNNNILHFVTWTGSNVSYWNSSNGGLTWSGIRTIPSSTATSSYINLIVNSTGGLFVFWNSGTEGTIKFSYRMNNNTFWETPKNIMPGTTGVHQWGTLNVVIDSNDVIHICGTSSTFNSSASNDFLFYTNLSTSVSPFVFFKDNSIRNSTHNYNGTWLNTNEADDFDYCDIDISKNNTIYIVSAGTDTTNLKITSSQNFSEIYTIANLNGLVNPSLSISQETENMFIGMYGTSENKPRVYNSTTNTFNKTWTNTLIDNKKGIRPDIATTWYNKTFIVYENGSGTNNEIWIGNTTENFTTWFNRTYTIKTSGWAGNINPSLRQSNNPVGNKIFDMIDVIFWNDTDNAIYIESINLTLPVIIPTYCNWIDVTNLSCDCSSNNGTIGYQADYDILNFTGTGTIHIDNSNITYRSLYMDSQCIVDMDTITRLEGNP